MFPENEFCRQDAGSTFCAGQAGRLPYFAGKG